MNNYSAAYYGTQVGRILRVRNVNEALPQALRLMQDQGVQTESRGLKTVRLPGPFLTVYTRPQERVLFDPVRDANPFFHMIDALWLLSGSNRVDLPRAFLGRIADFSDDGSTFHGSYGYRLRHAFGFDQVESACEILQQKPDSRQVVMSIWHPALDLGAETKDMPCNDMIMLDIVGDQLCMTVCNRSNDVVWGAYGANVVQFSMLQEYMAGRIGVNVGPYTQMSNNFHVYQDNSFWAAYRDGATSKHDFYGMGECKPLPVARDQRDALAVFYDCRLLADAAEAGESLTTALYTSPFFERVVRPMLQAYDLYKQRRLTQAFALTEEIEATDWRLACMLWLERRLAKEAA
jgi:hypothetical protein